MASSTAITGFCLALLLRCIVAFQPSHLHGIEPKSITRNSSANYTCAEPVSAFFNKDAYNFHEHCPTTAPELRPPITIMISLDGFRPEYLNRSLTPHLQAQIDRGFFAETRPQFPSYTFPNHICLVTGRFPEDHGITNNVFYDSKLNDSFSYKNSTSLLMSKWWLADPIWNTAQAYGVKTGVVFWPGSEVAIGNTPFQRPTYTAKYNESWSEIERFNQLLAWIDLEAASSPLLLCCYINLVDTIGHIYGTQGDPMKNALVQVDRAIGYLVSELARRGIDDRVNLMIVSDHGMEDTSPQKYIYLEDAKVELKDCFSFDVGATAFLEPLNASRIGEIYTKLKSYAKEHGHFTVSYKSELDEALRYGSGSRVSSIVVISEPGYFFTSKHDGWRPQGLHGYLSEHLSMHSIFIYSGPALSETAKALEKRVYSNLDVYPFACKLLGFEGLPGNGSNILAEQLVKPDYLPTLGSLKRAASGSRLAIASPNPTGHQRSEQGSSPAFLFSSAALCFSMMLAISHAFL